MRKYQILQLLGDGTYGSVVKARVTADGDDSNSNSGSFVAIKKMKRKFVTWDECLQHREVRVLTTLRHPNIVRLLEVIREHDELFFVFEYLNENLYQIMKDRERHFPESKIRNMLYQVVQGLLYMHKRGIFHRDISFVSFLFLDQPRLEPENLLVVRERVKIADFGLAREIRSLPPYTEYVSTRWYRAPEVILKGTYNAPIDVWGVGCVAAELYALSPIFPGTSELDQLHKISAIIGSPTMDTWKEGLHLARTTGFRFPDDHSIQISLKTFIPGASDQAVDLISKMLQWDPLRRPNCMQILAHPYFHVSVCFRRFFPDDAQRDEEARREDHVVRSDVHRAPRRPNATTRDPFGRM